MSSLNITNRLVRYARKIWRTLSGGQVTLRVAQVRTMASRWRKTPFSGTVVVLVGTVIATLFIMLLDYTVGPLTNPGLIYLPLVAMLAYHWAVRHAVLATILQL